MHFKFQTRNKRGDLEKLVLSTFQVPDLNAPQYDFGPGIKFLGAQ